MCLLYSFQNRSKGQNLKFLNQMQFSFLCTEFLTNKTIIPPNQFYSFVHTKGYTNIINMLRNHKILSCKFNTYSFCQTHKMFQLISEIVITSSATFSQQAIFCPSNWLPLFKQKSNWYTHQAQSTHQPKNKFKHPHC